MHKKNDISFLPLRLENIKRVVKTQLSMYYKDVLQQVLLMHCWTECKLI